MFKLHTNNYDVSSVVLFLESLDDIKRDLGLLLAIQLYLLFKNAALARYLKL